MVLILFLVTAVFTPVPYTFVWFLSCRFYTFTFFSKLDLIMHFSSFLLLGGIPLVLGKVQFMVCRISRSVWSWSDINREWISRGLTLAVKSMYGAYVSENLHFADDFQGTCPLSSVSAPLTSLGGGDGAGQMQHFVTDDQMNIFRLRMSARPALNTC